MKTVFTTGEAAKICKVSQQTIIRCFDSGQLKGFRVPGSRFRRIPREQLFAFMRENGIPTDALESGKRKILIVDDDNDLVDLMVDVLDRDGRFEVRSVDNGFDAGMMVKEYRPDLIVLDVMLARHQRQGSLSASSFGQHDRGHQNPLHFGHGRRRQDRRPQGRRCRRLPAQAVRSRVTHRPYLPSVGNRDRHRIVASCRIDHATLCRQHTRPSATGG